MNGEIDLDTWMPSDGISFEYWQELRDRFYNPEKFEAPKETEWRNYYVGVDLGKRSDPSTVAVIELQTAPNGDKFFYERFLKRFTLRMLYTDIASTLSKLDTQLIARAATEGKKADVVYNLDASGVGEGVAEIVEAKMPRAEIYRTYITGGINPTLDGHEIRLPKQQLVSTLLAAFDRDRLYLSKNSRELDAMLSELETFEIHVSESGADQYGAFKTGSHDDLVVALGLAVWLGNELGTRTVMMW